MKLILASASPRRAQLLTQAGFAFEVFPAEIDESRLPNESATDLVLRLAEAKARGVAAQFTAPAGSSQDDTIVLGADTIVELDGDVLGKPASAEDARIMLRRLSGRTHRVLTGVCIVSVRSGRSRCEVESTEVRFAALRTEEIDWYVETGEPLDKAGAYAIQRLGARFIEGIAGCYFNVVGLPIRCVYRMLLEFGFRTGSQGV